MKSKKQIRADKKERPITDLKVITAVVFTNPVDEAEIILKDEIAKNIQRRLAEEKKSVLPTIIYSSGEKALEEERAAVGMTRSIEDVSKKRKSDF